MQKESVNVETALTWIWEKIQIDEAVELSDLFPATAGRSEIVATFLAILELGRFKEDTRSTTYCIWIHLCGGPRSHVT